MKLIVFEDPDSYYTQDSCVRAYHAEKFLGMKQCPCILDDKSKGYELIFRFENDWNIRLNPYTDWMEEGEEHRIGEESVFIENKIPAELTDQTITDDEDFRRLIMKNVIRDFFNFLTKKGFGEIFNVQDEINSQAEILKMNQMKNKEE